MGGGVEEGTTPWLAPTGWECTDCGSRIRYTEDVFLLQMCQLQEYDKRTHYHQVIDEDDVKGDFLYEPAYFCEECWDALFESLKDDLEDAPPVDDPESDFECTCCGSGIRAWELVGVFVAGAFQRSTRAPNGVGGPRFIPESPELMCLSCLVLLNEHLEFWANLSEQGECADCVHMRCWRLGDYCDCDCHNHPGERTE